MILETIPAIQSLTIDQKLRLVWEIWNDVSHSIELSTGIRGFLDGRVEEYEADPHATRTTDEVTEGILQLKKRIVESRK